MKTAALIAALLWPVWTGAEIARPVIPGLIPQSVEVLDDQNHTQSLSSIMLGSQPVLLLPLFTRCPASCPLMVRTLKNALKEAPLPFRVVMYSFDVTDTPQSIQTFRKRNAMPADWITIRSKDGASVRAFFDQLNFRFMSDQGTYLHPRELFVFSGGLKWSATLTGINWDGDALRRVYRDAQSIDKPSWWKWWSFPDHWVALCGIAIVLALLFAAFLLWR